MEEKIKTLQTPRRRSFLFIFSQRLGVSALITASPSIQICSSSKKKAALLLAEDKEKRLTEKFQGPNRRNLAGRFDCRKCKRKMSAGMRVTVFDPMRLIKARLTRSAVK
jgi:hypothetical protein